MGVAGNGERVKPLAAWVEQVGLERQRRHALWPKHPSPSDAAGASWNAPQPRARPNGPPSSDRPPVAAQRRLRRPPLLEVKDKQNFPAVIEVLHRGALLGAAWVQRGGEPTESGLVIARGLSHSQARSPFPLFSIARSPGLRSRVT